jgi:hypothetical protein
MAAQTLALAGKRFVLLPESEYRKLRGRNGAAPKRAAKPRKHRMTKQDWGDVAEAKRRANEPTKPIEALLAKLRLD